MRLLELVRSYGVLGGIGKWWNSLPYGTRAALVWAVAGVGAFFITWKHEVGK